MVQVDRKDPVRGAAAAEALSALLVLLAPSGCALHDAPPPPGDLLTEARLAGAFPYCLSCWLVVCGSVCNLEHCKIFMELTKPVQSVAIHHNTYPVVGGNN